MKYRALGDTGVFVSELCLGSMTFGGRGQIWQAIGGLDENSADAIVGRALDGGINFIDTADVYSSGESEEMVGKALQGRRHEVVLATNPTIEGDTTALYLDRLLKDLDVRVTRLAHGLSVGTEIEYANAITLARALKNRSEL